MSLPTNPIEEFHQGHCRLCPRMCGADRRSGSRAASIADSTASCAGHAALAPATGFCGCGTEMMAARAALHHWEEPCISGPRGSGTIFFSGCTLRCCFCQNHQISQGQFGKRLTSKDLAAVCLRLQDEGAHNINLVTATQYLPMILPALDSIKFRLTIPVVYNCGGYERVETIRALKDYVDIWLPDLKYFDPALSARYSNAPDYFEKSSIAIQQMIDQTGAPKFHHLDRPNPTDCDASGNTSGYISGGTSGGNSDGATAAPPIMDRGVIIRHMVLPGHKDDSIRLLHWIAETLTKGAYYISLLSQYTPFYHSSDYPELNRRITTYEYQKVVDTALELGLDQGFMQEKSSAKEEYTPPFNLEGL